MSELGKLLMQGSFSVWTEHKKGHAKVKDLARFKPMQRHLFLHEKALLFCKRREENGEGYEKAPSYCFKQSLNVSTSTSSILCFIAFISNTVGFLLNNVSPHCLFKQMSAVGITENAKGDNKKFEIWCNSREEVYIVQVCKHNGLLVLVVSNIQFTHYMLFVAFQAPTTDVKTTWVNEIRKVLTTQLEAARGTVL